MNIGKSNTFSINRWGCDKNSKRLVHKKKLQILIGEGVIRIQRDLYIKKTSNTT